ncbi:cobalt ABC transporter permease [Weissella viridescens]|uniref:ABC superfamily ATP binding cassette transporter, membrane protein n=2 Tax=Weissella viridescens TaxID=1629 RepID=A0A0R2H3M1_WEIVI|nr:energy-coupling factor transporter transmembrane component T [Weissella viridescens]KRN46974.1 ABC superfamily ATP binding cassette transporter, membrane protein [Weissella viridescens]GEA94319.1 cobalt ABC transporter permease [Weissella viridescens]SUP59142.1 Energy-coupling factor transporter transmembrane protein EcfT [Weissella viridescens]
MNHNIFGFHPGTTPIHQLTGTTKLIIFLSLTIFGSLSFDLRYLLLLSVVAIGALFVAKIKWTDVRVLVWLVIVFAILNLILIYVFAPQYGTHLFGSKTVLLGSGAYALTFEQLYYEIIVFTKYLFALPLALIFLMTTNPSEFSAGLNKIGISYRVAYAVALALRYIPDIQVEYQTISKVQQARGYDMSKNTSLWHRLKGAVGIMMPLMFTSLEQIDSVSRAMDLRRFGKRKRRTWYYAQKFKTLDWWAIALTSLLIGIELVLLLTNGSRFWYPFK